ncbi:permease-like cell division protein FtsX [Rheinheimera sp. UJ51]|uniref:permease-like cell division protein FtsX n=1 Tax=Rheinheimera sp. UJ51 TaxID=2892446 RepID=UPI001E484573|nr:permease-like cell division protein FtsX [Rheinheimera sp. UJ51]MCC5450906.1 permease-like cell division protein FtsX [Rheinheimera sp. UJ51]
MSILFTGRATGAKANRIGLVRRFLMFFVHHIRQALSSLGELWRTPAASFLTIIVLGLSLTLPVTLHLLVKNAQQISNSFAKAAEINLFILEDASAAQIQSLQTILKADPQITAVRHINKADAMAEFQAASSFGEALNYLTQNPLPDVLVVMPANTEPAAARALMQQLAAERIVEFAKLDLEWLTRLEAVVRLMQQAVIAIALLLLSAVLFIVSNTIRLSIISKQAEIEVMKLVGATDSFIQRPFLYTGFWFGVLGGLLAFLVSETLLWGLRGAISDITSLYQSDFQLQAMNLYEFCGVILLAVSLGVGGSYLSVRRHIRAIEPSGP